MIRALAKSIDRHGYRRQLAALASAVYGYRGQRFSVDPEGRWISRHPMATFASPSVFIATPDFLDRTCADIFTYAYPAMQGDTIVDVGAGIGTEAPTFSRMVGPTGRVIAIEAHPVTAAALRETVRLNGLSNVTVVECAITATDCEVCISSGESHVANAIGQGDITVPGRSFDVLMAEMDAHPTFVKMNIEGAEIGALRGMRSNPPKHLCISCHDFIGVPTKSEVTRMLTELGYAVFSRSDDPRPWVNDYVYGHRPG